jgi:hypothetical protein
MEAKTPVEGRGVSKMDEAVILDELVMERIGNDILICGKVKKDVKE